MSEAVAEPSAAGPVCPACHAPVSADDAFCESCGAELTGARAPAPAPGQVPSADPSGGMPGAPDLDRPSTATTPLRARPAEPAGPRPCRECGGAVEDGYCTQCGAKAPSERDHLEQVAGPRVAMVSDRGIRHSRNEDAGAVDADGARAALVVCDGVSSAPDSDAASLAAVRAAVTALGTGSLGLAAGSGPALVGALGARVEAAAQAAARAVADATGPGAGDSPPSCTFVAAAVQDPVAVVGVVGDSRAYWLPDGGEPRVLTIDDSVAGQQIAAGTPRAQAESGPQAHAITRWLGVDSPGQEARLTTLEAEGPGWLLLCSDGLWNYVSEAAAIGDLFRRTAATVGDGPRDLAAAMVDWAVAAGGHDNITVALARLDGRQEREGADPA